MSLKSQVHVQAVDSAGTSQTQAGKSSMRWPWKFENEEKRKHEK